MTNDELLQVELPALAALEDCARAVLKGDTDRLEELRALLNQHEQELLAHAEQLSAAATEAWRDLLLDGSTSAERFLAGRLTEFRLRQGVVGPDRLLALLALIHQVAAMAWYHAQANELSNGEKLDPTRQRKLQKRTASARKQCEASGKSLATFQRALERMAQMARRRDQPASAKPKNPQRVD